MALLYVARRMTLLPILVVVSALLVLPLVHDDFTPLLKARYTMPLIPLVYVAIALFLARVLDEYGGRDAGSRRHWPVS